MEVFNRNSSTLYIHKPTNSSVAGDITLYEGCEDMPEVLIFYLMFQFINMFLGIPANLMVLWLLHKTKGDSSTSDIFILQLAILDTLFCLLPPLELASIVFLTTRSTWYVLNFFYGLKDFSPLFLTCICLDRYMAVLHPITFTELKDRSHRMVCVIVVWLISLAYAGAKSVWRYSLNFEKVFTVLILATFAVMLFCNVAILHALRQLGPGHDKMNPVKKKAFKMVFIILAIVVFNYFPPVALFPFQEYFSLDEFYCYVYPIAFAFLDISSSIQPILYLSRETDRVPCCSPKDQGSRNSTDSH